MLNHHYIFRNVWGRMKFQGNRFIGGDIGLCAFVVGRWANSPLMESCLASDLLPCSCSIIRRDDNQTDATQKEELNSSGSIFAPSNFPSWFTVHQPKSRVTMKNGTEPCRGIKELSNRSGDSNNHLYTCTRTLNKNRCYTTCSRVDHLLPFSQSTKM